MANKKLTAVLGKASVLVKVARELLGDNSSATDQRELAYRLWNQPSSRIATLLKKAKEKHSQKFASDEEDEDFFAGDDEDMEEENDSEENDSEEDDSEACGNKYATEEEIFGRISSDDSDILSFVGGSDLDPYEEGESDPDIEELLASTCSRNKTASKSSLNDDLFSGFEDLENDLISMSKKASQDYVAESDVSFDNSYEGDSFYGAQSESMIDDFFSGDLEDQMTMSRAMSRSASQEEYIAEPLATIEVLDDPMLPIASTIQQKPRTKKASTGAKTLGSVISGGSEDDEIRMLEKLWTKKPDISKLIG